VSPGAWAGDGAAGVETLAEKPMLHGRVVIEEGKL
jgi:hypothetical protein